MNPVPSPAPSAVAPHPWRAFGGICRLTFRRFRLPVHWFTLGALLALLGLICVTFHGAKNGASLYVGWMVNFYLTFLVPIIAFINATGAIRDDMKSGTVDYVLTRPVRRPAFIVFHYLSHLACAQADFLLSYAVVLAVGAWRGVPGIAAAAGPLLYAQVLLVAAFSALGLLCGVLTSRPVILGLAYGAIIEVGLGQIPTQISRLSMTHQVRAMLQPLAPDYPGLPAGGDLFTTSVALLGFTLVGLALAAALFTRREFAGSGET